jgi:hypothetical protein
VVQKLAGVGGLSFAGRAEHRADQGPGAGLHEGHQLQHRVAAAALGPEAVHVPCALWDLDGAAAVEGDRAERPEPHAGCPRLGEQPGQHLEQPPHRRGADPAAQVTQGFRSRRYHSQAGQPRGQLLPDQPIADLREQTHREHEVHPDPRGQVPQSTLHETCLLQYRVDELERQDLRQLAQMAGGEPTWSKPSTRGRQSSDQVAGHNDMQATELRNNRQSWRTTCSNGAPLPTFRTGAEPTANSLATSRNALTTRPWIKPRLYPHPADARARQATPIEPVRYCSPTGG